MNKTKRIAVIAIIALLPFGVWAEPSGEWELDEGVAVASDDGYYMGADIDDADSSHIATTAYVKGAYNDSVAMVNRLHKDKQTRLYYDDGVHNVEMGNFVDQNLNNPFADRLISSLAVKNAIDSVNSTISNKRVKIYTTWDTTDTTQVTLDNVQ